MAQVKMKKIYLKFIKYGNWYDHSQFGYIHLQYIIVSSREINSIFLACHMSICFI